MKKLIEKQSLLLIGVLFLIFALSFLFYNILLAIEGGWNFPSASFLIISMIALVGLIAVIIWLLVKK